MTKYITCALLLVMIIFNSSFKRDYQQAVLSGKEIYEKNCVRCHGVTGNKGSFGAKDFKTSAASDSVIVYMIANGRRLMPSFKKKLSPDQIVKVKEYVKILRNSPGKSF